MYPTGPEIQHPFDGKPLTREVIDENGNLRFEVTAAVLTPLRAKMADELALCTAVAVPALLILEVMQHDPSLPKLVFAAATYFFRPVFELVARKSLRRAVKMVMTAEEFRFRTWRGWRAFDRALDHRFALVLHDKARQERDLNELEERKAQQNRRVIQKRRYYQESWHLSFNYVKQRNDIVSIYGGPDARAVQARLTALDEVINARAKRGDGTAMRPEDQWVDQPGAIPETAEH